MNLPAGAEQALAAFGQCPGWEQRARLLMQWGERLPALSDDARLLRWLLALLLARVNGLTGTELAEIDPADWFGQLGLARQLSPSRSNGLNAVLQRMRELTRDA